MEAKELESLSNDELQAKEHELKKELYKLKTEYRFSRNIDKPHRLSSMRKDIARIKTVKQQRVAGVKEGAQS